MANTNAYVPKLVSFSEFNSLVFLKFDYERWAVTRFFSVFLSLSPVVTEGVLDSIE